MPEAAEREKTKEENKEPLTPNCCVDRQDLLGSQSSMQEIFIEKQKLKKRFRSVGSSSGTENTSAVQFNKKGRRGEWGRNRTDIEIFKAAQVWKAFHVRLPEENGKNTHGWEIKGLWRGRTERVRSQKKASLKSSSGERLKLKQLRKFYFCTAKDSEEDEEPETKCCRADHCRSMSWAVGKRRRFEQQGSTEPPLLWCSPPWGSGWGTIMHPWILAAMSWGPPHINLHHQSSPSHPTAVYFSCFPLSGTSPSLQLIMKRWFWIFSVTSIPPPK